MLSMQAVLILDDELVGPYTPDEFDYEGTLKVEIDPGVRLNVSLTHSNKQANQRYHQTIARQGETSFSSADFSIRLDKDPMARNGFSLDVGRSPAGSNLKRPGDVVGRVLDAQRAETGCHFDSHFSHVTADAFNMFLARMQRFLESDE